MNSNNLVLTKFKNLQKGLVAEVDGNMEPFHSLDIEPVQVDLGLLAVPDLHSLLEPALAE